jgi:peptidoglycan/LPS O-acetylase OafA/YrhL
MFMQIVAAFACLLAALLQFAVFRDPNIRDPFVRLHGRRITMVTMFLAGIYAANSAINGTPPSAAFLILALIGIGQAVFAISTLLPHLEKEHPWTSRLNSSQ